MKKITPALLACLITTLTTAQDVRLNDSVIFINNKPVALYAKQLNSSLPRYNMEVYSFDDYVLIKAEVIKFDALVTELESFYYHEITFPSTADTLAIYAENEDLAFVIARLISDYDLINKNELNKKKLARFLQEYPGQKALIAKINALATHLDFTRDYSLQTVRNRSKPVFIDESGVIMQDNVMIGKAKAVTRFYLTDRPIGSDPYNKPVYDIPYKVKADPVVNTYKKTEIYFVNGTMLDERKSSLYLKTSKSTELKTGNELYEISKPKHSSQEAISLLKHVCFLIENMML